MSDEIEVRRHPNNQISLTCGAETFARLWRAVVAEAGPLDGLPDRYPVRLILIERVTPARPPDWWGDRLGLFGCGAVASVILFVLSIGLMTIVGWVWSP